MLWVPLVGDRQVHRFLRSGDVDPRVGRGSEVHPCTPDLSALRIVEFVGMGSAFSTKRELVPNLSERPNFRPDEADFFHQSR